MGLLDELKQEAEILKSQDEDDAPDDTQAEIERAQRLLEAKMKALYKYFTEFCEHLNVVTPDVSGDYLLEGLGQGVWNRR